jgi:uncharacterized membrane protein YidH (DUF202 family)
MGIGFGIGMVLVGLVLVLRVVEVDIPYVDDYSLGILLIVLGIIGIVLTLMAWNRTSRSHVIEERRIDDPGLP